MNSIDVHTLLLNEAISYIKRSIDIAYNNNETYLDVIHGFNKGSKIKNWCLKEGNNINHVLKVEAGSNEGITRFYLNINFKKI